MLLTVSHVIKTMEVILLYENSLDSCEHKHQNCLSGVKNKTSQDYGK